MHTLSAQRSDGGRARSFCSKALMALCTAFVLNFSLTPAVADPVVLGAKDAREANAIGELVLELEAWLDQKSDYPAAKAAPSAIVISAPRTLEDADFDPLHARRTTAGIYDPDTFTIHLQRPWSWDNDRDVSVLLHELVHHRQVNSRRWYCPKAMEWDAYKLQEKFLTERGLESRIYWVAVVLESSCSRRDHHPDN